MRRTLPSLFALLLVAAACGDATLPVTDQPDLARAATGSGWVVVFDPGVQDPPGLARQLVAAHGGQLRFTYTHALRGFAADLPDAAVAALRTNPNVAYVEPDAPVQLFDTQTNPPWGLDRIDQRDLPLSGTYTYNNTGSGTNVYIFDTGVRRTHNDFGGRVQYVPNGSNGNFVGDAHGSAEDCHGHGTHVAGTAAGSTYGVAKGAPIWAARVVNCQGGGQVSMAIAAVDWATANALRPAVVNMSLGYGDVQSLRTAVENSIAAGVNYAVAAGNGDFLGRPLNACNESPAGAPNANTIGATSSNDSEASFSNYGPCVDILAPGVGVLSAWYTSNTATNTISGTSMATPHVAGAIALYLTANPAASPAQVSQALTDNASLNTINLHSRSASNGTPNRFLYTAFIGGGGEPQNQAPNAAFTFTCTDLSCSFDGSGSSDSDGAIVSHAWTFGDGTTGSGATVDKTYATGGTFTVTLTVTDDDGATGNASQNVTVTAPGGGGITLSAVGYKVRGVKHTDLTWSGAGSTQVDIRRDGAVVATTANDGFHTDNTGAKGGGSFTYRVCEAGTATCSPDVVVSY